MPTFPGVALATFGFTFAGLAGAFLFLLRAILRESKARIVAPLLAPVGTSPDDALEIAKLNARVTLLEDRFGAHREEINAEVGRARSAFASARQTLQRAREIADELAQERQAADDVRGEDESGSEGGGVLPLRAGMAGASEPQDATERLRVMLAREAFGGAAIR